MPPSVFDAKIFDAYVMVDWSAAAEPVTGPNSIWISCFERVEGALLPRAILNPSTRAEAQERLADLLSDLLSRDRVVLAGFDFPFGYPTGFAARLRPGNPEWRSVWKEFAARFSGGQEAARERFAIAADINRRISRRAFPFWGCHQGQPPEYLTTTRPDGYGPGGLAEKRLTEERVPSTQPVWKLAYPGSVGSQALTGIPHVFKLRHHPWLQAHARVWPFETGLRALDRPHGNGWRLLMAEVYPSLIRPAVSRNEVKDAVQVEALARHFAALDEAGHLSPLFAGDLALSPAARAAVEREEGWILGVTVSVQPPGPPKYLADPKTIYDASFARIRAEVNLSELPEDLCPVAIRLVHACGMPDLIEDLAFSADVVRAARAALDRGATILVDTEMVAQGILRGRLKDNPVRCFLNDPGTVALAERMKTTRSAAAVNQWVDFLEGAVVVIGNAPTALFRLLELLSEGVPRPAAVLAFPVGFVGAAESKEALVLHCSEVPYLTVLGRRGGSAMAAAALNALTGPVGEGMATPDEASS
ncbi:MAG: precorrin-8X methylmutase [Alphaproteobacteria bacterium]